MASELRLKNMHERHPALTVSIAGSYEEAASVCLSRHHQPPIQVNMTDNESEDTAEIAWIIPDSRILGAWANRTDTTEAGAWLRNCWH
jgi:hypothetical protein